MTTETDYWQQRSSREALHAEQEHEARMAAIEDVKQAALAAVFQFDEAGRAMVHAANR